MKRPRRMPQPPCLASLNLAGCRTSSRTPSEIDKKVVYPKDSTRLESHLVNGIELGTKPGEFPIRAESKNLLGNPLAIIEAEYLDHQVVCVEGGEVAVVE